MIAFCGLPLLSWIVNIICMRHYDLTKTEMERVEVEVYNRAEASEDVAAEVLEAEGDAEQAAEAAAIAEEIAKDKAADGEQS